MDRLFFGPLNELLAESLSFTDIRLSDRKGR
jgi:hypothetical protein